MKAKISFSLPEEQIPHRCAIHGQDLVSLIREFDEELRLKIKRQDGPLTAGRTDARNLLRELINESGLYNLIFEDQGY